MQSIDSLAHMRTAYTTVPPRMRDGIAGRTKKIEQLKAEGRSQAFIAETMKSDDARLLAALNADLQSLREMAATAETQKPLWGSRALLMSTQRFSDDGQVHALTALSLATSLPALPLLELDLAMRDAIFDAKANVPGALARVWACVQAGRHAAAGSLPVWDDLEIPNQRRALEILAGVDAALAEAELIVAGLSGLSLAPAQKLAIGRRMAPNAPTRRTSPDRVLRS